MHIAPWNTVTSGQQGQAGKSNAESQGKALLGKTEELFFPETRIPQTKYIIWKTADTLDLVKLKDLPFLVLRMYKWWMYKWHPEVLHAY